MITSTYVNILGKVLLVTILTLQPIFAQKYTYSSIQLGKIRYANKVLKEGIAKKDSLQIAEAYYLLGKIEANTGNYLTSQNLFLKSLSIQELYGDSYKLGRLYIRLHENSLGQGHYEDGLKYVRIALNIFQRVKSDLGLSHAYTALARFYIPSTSLNDEFSKKPSFIKPDYDSAFYYFKKAEAHTIKIKDTLSLAYLQIAFGGLAQIKKNPNTIAYYQTALDIFSSKNKKSESLHTMLDLAGAYLAFNQPKKAYKLILQAQKLYNEELLNEYDSQHHLANLYVTYFRTVGNWEQAFKHLENANKLDKRQILADHEGAVSRLNVEYETKKKEVLLLKQKEELILQAQNFRIQQQFLIAFASLLIITIGLSFVFYQLYRKNKRISHWNIVLVKEQNHRVKNNLQVISSLLSLQSNRLTDLVAKQAVEESMLRIEAMAILHRKLYDGDELTVVNLSNFIIELVESVLNSFGFGEIEPTYSMPKIQLSADQALPIGLIINELVTNSCKYAFPDRLNPSLNITCFSEKNELVIKVVDNGMGFENSDLTLDPIETSKTFGIRLIQMQVAQLNGSYHFEYNNGVKFTMKFTPLNNFSGH
ncbi:tetratricopeptide repeat-containing sensor histidine kinase [Emticicia sp. SJ17W-69]|uniref:tetratricopeptide repeat-containing sensor histidine kinase n=1 Tax=Emticicia sp. SJ17W-69 TaxID=3421657 RepID=UPI003EBDF1D8